MMELSTITPDSDTLLDSIQELRTQIGKRIIGQQTVLDEVLMSLVAGRHALLVGVPGLAKTMLVRALAEAMHLDFRRVQFTPDLVPSDITGTEVMDVDDETGKRGFRFVEGPIFANVVLADEINRTPPRTQAALLEAMQEHSVTAAGRTMSLPEPFFVLATQNPIEQEGTYPLPEAQLDRFVFDIRIDYPDEEEEVEVLRNTTGAEGEPVDAVLDAEQVLAMQRMVRDIPAADAALRYAATLARATRPEGSPVERVREYVRWGAGPRAGQALILGAKASAFLNGRPNVSIGDIQRVAHPVLRHRILLNFAAATDSVTVENVIDSLVDEVAAPKSGIAA